MPEDAQEKKPVWLNRNIFGMGLAGLFSDMNHEMATAVLPAFLSSSRRRLLWSLPPCLLACASSRKYKKGLQ